MTWWDEFVYFLTIKPRLATLKELLPEAEIHPCGSRYVCSPPSLTTDIDFLVYTEDAIAVKLAQFGFEMTAFQNYFGDGGDFTSWRSGPVNLIVTHSIKYRDGFILATHICKAKNVRSKQDRVMIYEGLRGNWDEWKHLTPLHFDKDLKALLDNLCGPYGVALQIAYRAQHGLLKE